MKKPEFIEGLHPIIKWAEIRKYRDHLISETDWTQMPDAPLSSAQKTEFANYRQALRDVPNNAGDPDDVEWPEKPAI
ncbi:tail fiber assembly protein [Vibrio parahaemolyticus]|uniref:tail fiber assembly protein n=1 Tax=Vibrio parahaemolyticus TaxID=670 RepID=UPI000649D834|nr:tail fiber assembly protein [Vibrio parahaemolyticus]EII3125342.1 phage tail assembly chaperone [Vibrio parahaemolyticus]